MKYRIVLVTCVIITLVVVLFSYTYAHSGSTDSDGGHYDRSSGEYHYHHGYSAHQHYDGECPYDFNDKTNHDSSSNKSAKRKKDTITFGEVVKKFFSFSMFFFGTFFIILGPYIYGFFDNKKIVTITLIILCIIGTILMTIFIK